MAPETAPPTKLQTCFQSLSKDFLRIRMVDICQEGHSQRPAPQKRHKVHQTGGRAETEAGTAEGRRPLHWGRVRSSSWLPELFGPGKAQNPGPTESVLLWSTRKPEPEQLGPGKSTQLGAAPWRAAGSPSSVDGESTHALSGGKPSVAGTLRVLPTQASEICLQRPPPRSTTEQVNLNKRPPPPSKCQGGK